MVEFFVGEAAARNVGVREHMEEPSKSRVPTELIPPVKESISAPISGDTSEGPSTSHKPKEISVETPVEATGGKTDL